jgi:redox-sensing transcriptional repressor
MAHVPDQTINRLPIYLRCLIQARALDIAVMNSHQLAQMAGTNAAQVRKDLSYLGELGTRGIGYDVEALVAHISDVLGVTDRRRVAIVGYGRLGGALHGYRGLADRGFEIVAVFDDDIAKIGTGAGDLTVSSIETLERDLQDLGVEIVILTTPTFVAQEIAERVAAAGVRAIMNFTYARLELPDEVKVRPVDLSVELQVLSFHLARTS